MPVLGSLYHNHVIFSTTVKNPCSNNATGIFIFYRKIYSAFRPPAVHLAGCRSAKRKEHFLPLIMPVNSVPAEKLLSANRGCSENHLPESHYGRNFREQVYYTILYSQFQYFYIIYSTCLVNYWVKIFKISGKISRLRRNIPCISAIATP